MIAVAASLSPLWYFQALERTWVVAILEGFIRLGHLIGIFIFVRSPEDTWVALAVQAIAYSLATIVELWLMYREIPLKVPNLSMSWVALRVSWSLFLARASDSFYTSANGVILGLLTSPIQVGFFENGNRLVRPGLAILWPLAQAIYPRINHLITHQARCRRGYATEPPGFVGHSRDWAGGRGTAGIPGPHPGDLAVW